MMKSKKLKSILKGVWAFCSFLFVPQWGKHPTDAGIMERRIYRETETEDYGNALSDIAYFGLA